MAPRRTRGPAIYPPIHSHTSRTTHLSLEEAQPLVAKYIQKSQKHPHYHPDSFLDPDGVQYGPKSGRNGGIVIHYLRRLEAGMRGEHLPLESREELQVKFGEDEVDGLMLPTSDDTRLDETIRATAKKERKSILKRKRNGEDVLAWAEESSQAGAPSSSQAEGAQEGDLQSQEEFEREQDEEVGEIGGEEGAPVSRQNGSKPFIVTHDAKGKVQVPQTNGKNISNAERKAAKKLRKKEEKRAREETRKTDAAEERVEPLTKKQKTEDGENVRPITEVFSINAASPKEAEAKAKRKRERKLEKKERLKAEAST